MSLPVTHHLRFSRIIFIESLAFFCAFILLAVSILFSLGSVLLSNDFSFSDRTENVGSDIEKDKEKNNYNCGDRYGFV